jgi:hypothetical protein
VCQRQQPLSSSPYDGNFSLPVLTLVFSLETFENDNWFIARFKPLMNLITGGLGFIGNELARQFSQAGEEVAMLDKASGQVGVFLSLT